MSISLATENVSRIIECVTVLVLKFADAFTYLREKIKFLFTFRIFNFWYVFWEKFVIFVLKVR